MRPFPEIPSLTGWETISHRVDDTILIVGISPSGVYSQIFTGAFQDANGKAGDINLVARRIRLDNLGTIASDAETGDGGNIRLQASDYVLSTNRCRRDSHN